MTAWLSTASGGLLRADRVVAIYPRPLDRTPGRIDVRVEGEAEHYTLASGLTIDDVTTAVHAARS